MIHKMSDEQFDAFIDTRLTEATDDKKEVEIEGHKIALGISKKVAAGFASLVRVGRAGTPEEAANGVYLFCTPESNYISGQLCIVGSGLSF